MATLTKANNTTALNLAGSWSPSQVPTAADALVFDSTYDTATGTSLRAGALVEGASLTFGAITNPVLLSLNPSTLSSPSSPLSYPWSLNAIDFSGANASLTVNGGMSAPDSSLSLTLAPGRSLVVQPSNSDVAATFPLVAGVPRLFFAAPASDASGNNYALSMVTANNNITVPATDDATLTTAAYQNTGVSMTTKTTILGHPTLPTAVTIEAPTTAVGGLFSGNGTPSFVTAINQDTSGKVYFGGGFTTVGSGSTQSISRIASYDPTTKQVAPLGMGISGVLYAIARDASNNLYVGSNGAPNGFSAANGTGTNSNFAKFDATNQIWVDIGNGVNGTVTAIAVSPVDGKVYLGGEFTATMDGLSVSRVACFDPATNTYSAMGVGATSNVKAIAIAANGDVYVGSMNLVGGTTSYCAKWTPSTSTWSVAGSTNIAVNITALAYDAANDKMYVGASTSSVVIDVPTNTSASLSIPGMTVVASVVAMAIANNKVYVGSNIGPYFQEYNPATTTWTTISGAFSGTGYLVAAYTDASGSVWVGLTGAVAFSGVGTANYIAKYNPATTTWSLMDYGYNRSLWGNSTASQNAVSFLYSGTNCSGSPIAIHGQGTKTYALAPNSNLSILTRQTTAEGTIIRVRRGGALLELPDITAQDGVSITTAGQITGNYVGDVAEVSLNGSATNVGYRYSLRSSATKLNVNFTQTSLTAGRTYLLNFKGSNLNLAAQTTFQNVYTGSLGNAAVTFSGRSTAGGTPAMALGTNSNFGGGTWTASAKPNVYGTPHQMSGPYTLGSVALTISSSYFKANNTFTVDPANPINLAVGFGANCIVDWTSNSGVVLSGQTAEIRVNSFASFPYLTGTKFVYSSASPLTLNKNISGNPTIVMEEGSGALTFDGFVGLGAGGGLATGQVSNFIALYNSADNVSVADMTGFGRGMSATLSVQGTGTLRIIRPTFQMPSLRAGGTAIIDFSDAGAPASDIILPYNTTAPFVSGTGTLTFKGKPSAVCSQYLVASTVQTAAAITTSFGDSYFTLAQNSATSLDVSISSFAPGVAFNPLYISGLSANATITQRTATASILQLNGIQGSTSTGFALILLGASGDANWIIPQQGIIAPYTSYTTLPTSGGATSTNYSVTGTQTQTGNTSAQVIKAIQSANNNVLTHTGFTVTATSFLLTGNQGGTYDIVGTQNSVFALSSIFIANASDAEMRILTQLNTSAAVTLSGPGTISLGSPTTTHRSAATTQARYLNATETRIYAGTDNLTPSITTANPTTYPQILVGSKGTLRLLGSGTGRTLNEGVTLGPNATLQVDEDWTVATVVGYGYSGVDNRINVNVAPTKTLTVNRWTTCAPQDAAPALFPILIPYRYVKKGAGLLRYRNMPYTTSNFPTPLVRIEAGSIEFNVIDASVIPQGYLAATGPMELLSGTSCSINSSVNHEFPFVIFGAGSVTKSNTGTVDVRVHNSFTGGLTISAGEYNAQYRQAVGDGNVTVSGGVLRASAVDEDQYALEIAGNLVFSGGSLALGDAYVA